MPRVACAQRESATVVNCDSSHNTDPTGSQFDTPNNGDIPAKAVACVLDCAPVEFDAWISLGEGRTMIKVQEQAQISMPEACDCWTSQQHIDHQAEDSAGCHAICTWESPSPHNRVPAYTSFQLKTEQAPCRQGF